MHEQMPERDGDHCVVARELPHPQPLALTFAGERHEGDTWVWVTEAGHATRILPLHIFVRRHSPTGFDWGYSGSGPAQLALALCVEVVGRGRAERVHQFVKDTLVAPITADSWTLGGDQILNAIEVTERKLGSACTA